MWRRPDEARRIASNVANLPVSLKPPKKKHANSLIKDCLDGALLIRMLLVGYVFAIRSEQRRALRYKSIRMWQRDKMLYPSVERERTLPSAALDRGQV